MGSQKQPGLFSQRADVDLRVNVAKCAVDDAKSALQDEDIMTTRVEGVPTALRVTKNPRRVAGSTAFNSGMVELQDAASQAVIDMLDIKDGSQVLDYCAGGGGKTLAMAGKAPEAIYSAWDVNAARLEPLKDRAKRAGIRVTVLTDEPAHEAFDIVFVDAPCSGSGSWRRSPEGKWRLTAERLTSLQAIQAEILLKAATNVKNGGILAYATCSLLNCEDRAQVDIFLSKNNDFYLISDRLFSVGKPGDGFYCAILQKQL